jgi:hypothetical protein
MDLCDVTIVLEVRKIIGGIAKILFLPKISHQANVQIETIG